MMHAKRYDVVHLSTNLLETLSVIIEYHRKFLCDVTIQFDNYSTHFDIDTSVKWMFWTCLGTDNVLPSKD